MSSSVMGPPAGSGKLVYLQKNDEGDWYVLFEDLTWIS